MVLLLLSSRREREREMWSRDNPSRRNGWEMDGQSSVSHMFVFGGRLPLHCLKFLSQCCHLVFQNDELDITRELVKRPSVEKSGAAHTHTHTHTHTRIHAHTYTYTYHIHKHAHVASSSSFNPVLFAPIISSLSLFRLRRGSGQETDSRAPCLLGQETFRDLCSDTNSK